MPKHDAALLAAARRVARLERERRNLQARLRTNAAQLKHERKLLRVVQMHRFTEANLRAEARAAARPSSDPFNQAPPVRGLDT